MDFRKAWDGAERQQNNYRQKNSGLFQLVAPLSANVVNNIQYYKNAYDDHKRPQADVENGTDVCPDSKKHFIERVHRENNVFLIDENHPQANGL